MTLIGPGTWEAARAALDSAVTAAQLVLDGAPAAYACTRPPGHHATRNAFGGSCYLNNSAAAAARLRAAGTAPVAVIDIDAHHGNGTQAIFWDDAGVLTGSVHVDPGAGWFPHFLGFEDERGARRLQPQHSPGARERRRSLASMPSTELAAWASERGAAALVVRARRGRRSRRLPRARSPSARRASALPDTCSGGSASRPWWCRRAATTWTR